MTGRIGLSLIALLLALLGAGCGSSDTKPIAPDEKSSSKAAWRLPDLEQSGRSYDLAALFNRSAGAPRLILLVSPT